MLAVADRIMHACSMEDGARCCETAEAGKGAVPPRESRSCDGRAYARSVRQDCEGVVYLFEMQYSNIG
jgi:hypothetical protein